MPFSSGQQGKFRPLVNRAWVITASSQGADIADKSAKRAWYEEQLEHATGHRTTSDCDAKLNYEQAMAHFEAILGDSIYWQMRLYSGNARRIYHEIRRQASDFEVDEHYLQGIARQALKIPANQPLPDLSALIPEHLLTILRALKIQLRRQTRRGQDTATVHRALDPDIEPW